MPDPTPSNNGDGQVAHHDAIIVGAGVAGIYQLYRLLELGLNVTVIEAGGGPGGTWYWNRYPGARFDSESYSYGYSFSKELLDEWDWSERFAPQPETLRYLQHVIEKFDLQRHMQFDCALKRAEWKEEARTWTLELADGRRLSCRFLLTALGLLSAPTLPKFEGMERFEGTSFHTSSWPHEPLDLSDKRVGIVGTGATAVQIIGEIADKVQELTVFQRRPNWCAPLHNAPVSKQEMAEIRERYDEIYARCHETPGGFIHAPPRESFHDVPREQRLAMWEELYNQPGFGIWLGNYREIFAEDEANAELSEFIAGKIRERVDDPEVAEKLIPKDHGFGVQRVPMETRYYEAYNRDNVHLVSILETPIVRVTPRGIETSEMELELDVIVYATGFDAITGSYDRIEFRGTDGQLLREKWTGSPKTYLGVQVHGFPNLFTIGGPTTSSTTTNVPRAIEFSVEWATRLIQHLVETGTTRIEATEEAELEWTDHVRELYGMLLLRNARSWFTGYNSNVERPEGPRYIIYNGGNPKYRKHLEEVAAEGYRGFELI